MSGNRTKKSAINMSVSVITRLVALVMGFVSRSIFLRFLSVEYLGINGLFSNILLILSFAELGLGNVMLYNMYKPIKENDEEEICSLLLLYKKAYTVIAVIVLVVGICLTPCLKWLITDAPDIDESITVIYWLYIFNTASSYLFSYKQSVLNADQNAYIVSLVTSIMSILMNVVHIAVLYLTHSYYVYLIATVAGSIATNAILAVYVDHKYPYIKKKDVRPIPKEKRKQIVKDVKALAISKVAGVACNGTDNIIITKMVNVSSVGLASNYTTLINSANGIVYQAVSGLTGSIGNLNAEDDTAARGRVFDQVFMLCYLLYSYLSVGLIVLSDVFIGDVWLGNEFLLPSTASLMLVLIIFQSGMNYTPYTFRTTLGYFEVMKYVYVGTAILNIGLSILLAKFWGITGVYAATILSKALSSEIGDGYYTYKYGLRRPVWQFFAKYACYCLLLAVSCVVCKWAIGLVAMSGIVGFLCKGVVLSVVWLLLHIIVFFQNKNFRELLNRARWIIHSKKKKGESDYV